MDSSSLALIVLLSPMLIHHLCSMNMTRTLTAIQVIRTDELLSSYRQFSGKQIATADELFAFLITPTPERNSFLSTNCAHTLSVSDNVVLSTYSAL